VHQLNHWIDSLVRHHQADERHARHVEPHRLDAARRLVSFVDQLSLALIGGVPAMTDPVDLPFGRTERPIRVIPGEREGEPWRLDPWPFAVESISLEVPAVGLTAGRFESPSEAYEAIKDAPASPVVVTVEP